MKRLMSALAMAMSMLLGTSFVYAQGTGAGTGAGSPPQAKSTESQARPDGREWSLTPDQRSKIMELHRSFMRDNAQLIGSLVTKKLEFKALWADPKSDDKALMDKEKEVSALKAQLKDKAFQMKLACRKILGPEQLANFMGHRCMMGHGMMDGGMVGGRGMGGHGMMGHHGMGYES
jgi:Spy/CpxP family protein refolding chaperone